MKRRLVYTSQKGATFQKTVFLLAAVRTRISQHWMDVRETGFKVGTWMEVAQNCVKSSVEPFGRTVR